MPPIGPLLNALNLSGSVVVTGVVVVVAMAVATAGWKVHIKRRVSKLRKYLRTGKKIERRSLLLPWKKKKVTSLPGISGELPRPLTKKDLRKGDVSPYSFIPKDLEKEFHVLLSLESRRIERLNSRLQDLKESLAELKSRKAELDNNIEQYAKSKERAGRLSKEASALESRFRSLESAFKAIAVIVEKVRDADPKVREIMEKRQEDGKKRVKGDESKIPVSTALKSFLRGAGRRTEGSRSSPRARESQQGQGRRR